MKKLIAANWKMYKTRSEAAETAHALVKDLEAHSLDDHLEVAVFAPFTNLAVCAEAMLGCKNIFLGAQNFYPEKEGAFTGEISPRMLLDCSCRFVLAGHSERRHILGESNEFVGKKTAYAMENGLDVVLCVGETLAQREAGGLEKVLHEQLVSGTSGIKHNFLPESLSIAYEPVWAIGTGKVAGAEEIVQAHACIRSFLEKLFPKKANEMRILYGGSVKADNAAAIIGLDNVDGLLVGGASLDAETFTRIVLA